MRTPASEPRIGERTGGFPALARACEDGRAQYVVGARVWTSGREVHPAIILFHRRHRCFPTDAEIQRQLVADAPIVLKVARKIGPLLSDEADGINAAVVDPP